MDDKVRVKVKRQDRLDDKIDDKAGGGVKKAGLTTKLAAGLRRQVGRQN
ncbi:MAG: hypothetical protein MPK62_13965 [Alphaproteobacteria bacterium]|nr:hypothetical protein [Alphaproteobacteria bacterium]MDA8032201.1 hypothetical protein [Alphaproteobacteria bacterium]